MNNPFITKFAAQAGDISLSNVTTSREFQLLKGSQLILKETYNYDADHNIRITGLADVLTQALYGTLTVGEQLNAKSAFTCKLTGEEDITATLYAMRMLNPKDMSGLKTVLAVAGNGVCYPDVQKLVTVIGVVTVSLVGTNLTTAIGSAGAVTTVNCDPKVLFPNNWQNGRALNIGNELLLQILPEPCTDRVQIRFLNRYDMPETLLAHHLVEKAGTTDDVSTMYGLRTRFSVQSSTEYTLHSGALHHDDEQDTWQDLLLSRKAQILWQGQWTDIVVTKSNFTRQRQQFRRQDIEISFQTANPLMIL